MLRSKIVNILEMIVPKVEIGVTVPEDEALGHYSTNIAFQLAKEQRKEPLVVAENIVSQLEQKAPPNFFGKVEVAPPGFINFWISEKVLQDELAEVLERKDLYGRPGKPARGGSALGRKIQVEFISANPTGPLTLANGRGGFLGDVLSNVLELSGYKVEREYYVNDAGNQIIVLGESLLAAEGLVPYGERLYMGDYVKDWAREHSSEVKKNKDDFLKLGQLAAGDFLKDIQRTVKGVGIHFDRWTSEEKHIRRKNLALKALEVFEKKGFVYEREGAKWLKTVDFSDDKDRVLVTSDGFPTYFLADSGHYFETKKRGFSTKINILGPDHHGYVKRIQAAAKILELKRSEIIVTQAIRLIREGKEMKMSKRRGEFVTFEDLVDEVGTDVARFFFLMHAPESHMDFDLELAKERSMKNPVYYVQYAYVRAVNILGKAGSRTVNRKAQMGLLNTEEDKNLIRKLVQFPEAVEDSANDFRVHRLTRYATQLARQFHDFYEKERVIGEEKDVATARLDLVRATSIVLKNLFSVLGISALEKM